MRVGKKKKRGNEIINFLRVIYVVSNVLIDYEWQYVILLV